MCSCVHLCLWTCVHVCVFEDVWVCVRMCVWVTYNYHGAARQFPELSSRGLLMGFSLHADAQNRDGEGGGDCCMERNTEWSECVCVCGRAGEELPLVVLFKSDLPAIWVVTYCRSAARSLSSSSELHTLWSFMLHKKTDGINSLR